MKYAAITTLLFLPLFLSSLLLAPRAEAGRGRDLIQVIEDAIHRGAPVYNRGDAEGCAAIYTVAAAALMQLPEGALPEMDRLDLQSALKASEHASAKERAWNLRHAFDRIAANEHFEPRMEAPLPQGFPAPGPVGRVVVKSYPQYRAARAEGRNPFWMLFRHIKKNDVQMTAPVEMTMSDDLRARDMAFMYEAPDQGVAGQQGSVRVLDLEPVTVLSVGVRGGRSAEMVERARAAVQAKLAADGWQRAGDWRLLGYNSPMVPANQRFWELQLPVARSSR